MGSEGRGEQILKTDQDNALILRDGFEHAGLEEVAQRFNAALAGFGYPPCPGDIMVTNRCGASPGGSPPSPTGTTARLPPRRAMHLAIFMDARAVAGDAELLRRASTCEACSAAAIAAGALPAPSNSSANPAAGGTPDHAAWS
jgi:CBS domain-containing protein